MTLQTVENTTSRLRSDTNGYYILENHFQRSPENELLKNESQTFI